MGSRSQLKPFHSIPFHSKPGDGMEWKGIHQVFSKHISTKASMGGFGSGGRNHKGGCTVDECIKLSVGLLRSAGALTKGRRGVVSWGSVAVNFETVGEDLVALRWNSGEHHQSIGFQWLAHRRPLGGHQIYLVCPTCLTARSALFFHRDCFRCRVCHRLSYPSQRERRLNRLRRKLEKLAKQLGSCYKREEVSVPPKPLWMRRKTYHSLATAYDQLLQQYAEETRIFLAAIL